MGLTLADVYYLKALDEYDYNLEEVVENLNYALSYDQEHAGANYLMGKLYMEQFQKFDLAEDYFVASLVTEPEHIQTCESYAWLMIRTKRYQEALKLIQYTYTLKGITTPEVIRMEALVYELSRNYIKSKELLHEAMQESYDSVYIDFLENELERVEKKEEYTKMLSYRIVG
jgi:tetratricopeptide (TPR) repeat protein